MATRFFGAFRNTISNLKEYYTALEEARPLADFSGEDARFPYPNTFTHHASSTKVHFKLTEQPTPNKLIFLGSTGLNNSPKLLVKFVRSYGKDLHQHCADLGYAPPLLGFEKVSGGWNMVVMQFMEDHTPFSTFSRRSSVSSNLRAKFKRLVDSFQKKNFVHGDLRASNLLVHEDENGRLSMKLVDFDWGGSEGEVRYPLALNRKDIKRPEGAVDGELITKEHDLRMVDDMFLGLP
jgi:serine/threonine protein kinase